MANQSVILVTARAEAVRSLLTAAAASLRIYTGAAPASPETSAPGTLLATVSFLTAVPAPVAGVLTLTAAGDTTVTTSGVAGWARLTTGSGAALLDMSVGIAGSGAEVVVTTTQLFQGGFVHVNSLTLT